MRWPAIIAFGLLAACKASVPPVQEREYDLQSTMYGGMEMCIAREIGEPFVFGTFPDRQVSFTLRWREGRSADKIDMTLWDIARLDAYRFSGSLSGIRQDDALARLEGYLGDGTIDIPSAFDTSVLSQYFSQRKRAEVATWLAPVTNSKDRHYLAQYHQGLMRSTRCDIRR